MAAAGIPQSLQHPRADQSSRDGQPRFRLFLLLMVACNGCVPSPPTPPTYIPQTYEHPPEPTPNQWLEAIPDSDQREPGDAVVRRRAASDSAAILLLVSRVCDGLSSADPRRLHRLFGPTAVAIDARGRQRPLALAWSVRLKKHDYSKLVDRQLCWLPRVSIVDGDSERIVAVPSTLLNHTDNLFVHVPLESQGVDGEVLYGSALWLRLGESATGLQITGYQEDFELD